MNTYQNQMRYLLSMREYFLWIQSQPFVFWQVGDWSEEKSFLYGKKQNMSSSWFRRTQRGIHQLLALSFSEATEALFSMRPFVVPFSKMIQEWLSQYYKKYPIVMWSWWSFPKNRIKSAVKQSRLKIAHLRLIISNIKFL